MPFVKLDQIAAFSAEKLQKHNFCACPQMVADVYCLEPGQEQRVHAHAAEAKLYYVIAGCGDVTLGAETRTLTAGEAAWSPAGEPHGVRNNGPQRLTLLVVIAPQSRR